VWGGVWGFVGEGEGLRISGRTLGHHYDWTARKYAALDGLPPMPRSAFEVSRSVAVAAHEAAQGAEGVVWVRGVRSFGDEDGGAGEIVEGERMERSSDLHLPCPEAAIVNFYREVTSMGGHRDDAELTDRWPIVSISLGCAAVFLISIQQGGGTDIPPAALLLRSGDAVVMGGASRLATHGLSTILRATAPEPLRAAVWSMLGGEVGVEEAGVAEAGEAAEESGHLAAESSEERREALPPSPQLPPGHLPAESSEEHGKAQSSSPHLPRSTELAHVCVVEDGPRIPLLRSRAEADAVCHFLSARRINLNVRQVFPE
jgi:2OG-Fe(II) oxygenase superfamily